MMNSYIHTIFHYKWADERLPKNSFLAPSAQDRVNTLIFIHFKPPPTPKEYGSAFVLRPQFQRRCHSHFFLGGIDGKGFLGFTIEEGVALTRVPSFFFSLGLFRVAFCRAAFPTELTVSARKAVCGIALTTG